MRLPSARVARVALLRDALKRIAGAKQAGELDEARAFLLWNLIETYFRRSVEDRKELRVQLDQEEDASMEATDLTWAGAIDLEATLRTQRKAIREVVQYKFGQVSPAVQAVINGTDAEEELDALFKRALAAQTEQDFLQATR